jgi:hypothetical protein
MSTTARRRLWSFFEAMFSQELTETQPKSPTPAWIKTPLLMHQQTALAAALRLEQAKMGIEVEGIPGDPVGGIFFTSQGILGDRVGSGKSLTALALVKSPPPNIQFSEYVLRNSSLGDGRDVGLLRNRSQLKTNAGTTLRRVTTCLFIVPHALISQWQTYVERDTHLKALFITKRQDASKENLLQTIEQYDALFISSTMWGTFRASNPTREILWTRVFIDEADSVSITTDWDEIHGIFYWFISASWLNLIFANGAYFNIAYTYTPLPETPPYVIERVSQLQGANANLSIPGCRHVNICRRMCAASANSSTMSINAAGIQSARLVIHSSADYIKTSFEAPAINHMNILCETPANIRVLDQFISPDMLEMLNAGDVTGALQSIGMTAHTEAEITTAVTASLKKELENAIKTLEFKKSIDYSTEQVKAKAIEVCEQKIASIQSRITAILERIKNAKQQDCPICYVEVANPAVTPCCQQLFCFSCLCESLKRVAACPLCRTRIEDLKSIQVVGSSGPVDTPAVIPNRKLNKRDAFVKFLKENPHAKVLMFSGYDATFNGMEAQLREENIKFATLNGSNARINKLLKEFGAGKWQTLFLNARNMGAGLNIDAATHVVLFHKMSQELEAQIIGRANRLGRTAPITVVHLLHDNESGNTIQHV